MLRCLVFLGLVLFVSAEATLADGQVSQSQSPLLNSDNAGKPEKMKSRGQPGIWIWYQDNKWSVNTHGAGKKANPSKFEGLITISNGKLNVLTGDRGERKGAFSDKFVFNLAKTQIQFDFNTGGGIDTIEFQADNPQASIDFFLKVDGSTSSDKIHLGKNAINPGSTKFRLAAVPPAASSPGLTADPTKKKK